MVQTTPWDRRHSGLLRCNHTPVSDTPGLDRSGGDFPVQCYPHASYYGERYDAGLRQQFGVFVGPLHIARTHPSRRPPPFAPCAPSSAAGPPSRRSTPPLAVRSVSRFAAALASTHGLTPAAPGARRSALDDADQPATRAALTAAE